jgi:histidinol-phosphate phosphatase family protein
MPVSVVVPTVGRPSLLALLESLARCDGPKPDQVVLVDDRRRPWDGLLDLSALPGWTRDRVMLLASAGRGPAAARNVGWRATSSEWVAFLDDDVVVSAFWLTDLATDLDCGAAGVQGIVTVPLPDDRPPTDWERGTAGLAAARWVTADMAYRRGVLAEVGGFDERFPRAFREDADLALRVLDAGYRIVTGRRTVAHPVRPASWWASVTQQRGNADDALMRRLHGRDWHQRAGASVGRRPRHLAITATAAVAGVTIPRRIGWYAAAIWLAGTAEFAWARIGAGPRDRAEVARMAITSVAIPPTATWHWIRGTVRARRVAPASLAPARSVDAVLVDRDGTIVQDVAYNGDPVRVEPMPGAQAALDRLRAAGLKVGVVTNQSGIARGLITREQVDAVNGRVEELLGPFDTWQVCPHGESDGCSCRKPQPGMVLAAAARLGVPVGRCAVIGDIGADLAAARAAGARAVLVPNGQTRPEETAAAPVVCGSLNEAVDYLIGDRR